MHLFGSNRAHSYCEKLLEVSKMFTSYLIQKKLKDFQCTQKGTSNFTNLNNERH